MDVEGVADRKKTPLLNMCCLAQRDRSGLNGVEIIKGEPQNWGSLGLRHLGWEAWLIPRNTPLPHAPPHICYYDERGRSVLKSIEINRREPRKLGTLGLRPLATGSGKPLKTSPSPYVLPRQILSFCVKGMADPKKHAAPPGVLTC